jgi:hypothetical protein
MTKVRRGPGEGGLGRPVGPSMRQRRAVPSRMSTRRWPVPLGAILVHLGIGSVYA